MINIKRYDWITAIRDEYVERGDVKKMVIKGKDYQVIAKVDTFFIIYDEYGIYSDFSYKYLESGYKNQLFETKNQQRLRKIKSIL